MLTRIETQAEPIPGYRLIERLGGGGFGEVWKAEAPGGLLKAIKFVYGDMDAVDSAESARADQEFKSLQRILEIRHPFILSIERWDKVNGQLMIVTELADKNLWDRFRECRNEGKIGIPREELLSYLFEAAEALDLMNKDYNLLHLDVKPQNLFLVKNHVKVADFGLVKTIEGVLASVTGGVTPVYAAPETFDGKVTRSSDQYSLGIVYQELLTGARPFTGNNTRHLIMQHLEGKPNLEPLPPGDRRIVARALSKDYEKRYPCCMDLIKELRDAGNPATLARLSALEDTSVEPDEAITPTQVADLGAAPAPSPVDLPASSHLLSQSTNVVKHEVFEASGSDLLAITPPKSQLRTPNRGQFGRAPATERTKVIRSQETGEGIFQPALVIGLGAYGRHALQHLRVEIEHRFGRLDDLPHLRLLCLDTDPEAAQKVGGPNQLRTDELLLTRLSRPSRYLQTRDLSLPPVENWLDAQLLYKMPRNLVTTGIRAFGRLAFLEHYRSFVARLRRDVEQITAAEALENAARVTGASLRSSAPRVIVIANLAGGTGGGMFLDLAYVVRAELRQLGFAAADVTGAFFLPPANDASWADLSQANVYAALVELEKAMRPGFAFRAQYEEKAEPLQDSEPPFGRCLFLPIPPCLPEAQTLADAAGLCGRYLQRILLTPLGRDTDKLRALTTPAPAGTSRYQSIGMHVLASPRRIMLRHAARLLTLNLMEEWTTTGAPDLIPELQTRIEATMVKHRLDPEHMVERLGNYVIKELKQSPDDTVAEWLDALRRAPGSILPNPEEMRQLVKKAEDFFGSPFATEAMHQSRVVGLARDLAEKFVRKVTPGIGIVVMQFLDRAGFRMGACDEASRVVQQHLQGWSDQLDQRLAATEKTLRELAKQVQSTIVEVERQRAGAKPRQGVSLPGFLNTFKKFCKLRFEQVLMQRLVSVYVSFRGYYSDQAKDLRFARGRLAEVRQLLEDARKKSLTRTPDHACLLPEGCATVADAVQQTVDHLPTDGSYALDQAVQAALQRRLPPLGELCLTPGDWPRQLQTIMLEEAEQLFEKQMQLKDAAELLMERAPDGHELIDEVLTAYDDAVPPIVEQHLEIQRELGLMLLPTSHAAERVAAAAEEGIRGIPCLFGGSRDEIVFYREYVGIMPRDLKQMGPAARHAYEVACTIDHFTPHSRMDVPEWTQQPVATT